MLEVWKDIAGYEGAYQVSSFGRVNSLARYRQSKNINAPLIWIKERILKPRIDANGYASVYLFNNNSKQFFFIHRLVVEAFIPNQKNKLRINHKDGLKLNNWVTNLERCTNSENQIHRAQILKKASGSKHPKSKLSEVEVNYIRDLIKRGYTNVALGKKFKVTDVTISNIRISKTYKSVEVNQ